MYKELTIVFFIIVTIIGLEYITQKYTSNIITEMTNIFHELEDEIRSNTTNNQEVNNNTNEIYNKWLKFHDILSLYIEHNELEKVETYFVTCKSLIESSEYNYAITELEKAIFVLDHIGDKYAFNISNIF